MATKKLKHLAEDIDETIDSFAEHKDDANIHVTQSEKAKWNSNVSANNGTLTIKRNGVEVGSFSANQSTSNEVDITVPTKVSELENDSEYVSQSVADGLQTQIDEIDTKVMDVPVFLSDDGSLFSKNLKDSTYSAKNINNVTLGNYCFSQGISNVCIGDSNNCLSSIGTVAIGYGIQANYHGTYLGKYNLVKDPNDIKVISFAVGNGGSKENRSNLFHVFSDGRMFVNGENADYFVDREKGGLQSQIDTAKNDIVCNLIDTSSITNISGNGITRTNNNDGSISYSGTATAITFQGLAKQNLTAGTYTFSGHPTKSPSIRYIYQIYKDNAFWKTVSSDMYTETNSFKFDVTDSGLYAFGVYLKNNEAIDETFFSHLEKGSNAHDYVNYTGTTGNINSDLAALLKRVASLEKALQVSVANEAAITTVNSTSELGDE